ncbi:MAG TPA: hypothetical protein VFK44_12730 [Bacillales bacterium]|nr:hypothetical protein [Bacillales bacterium]
MKIAKITSKSLVLNEDLSYNQRLGLPVEVFSTRENKTVAFGKIRLYSDQFICVNDQFFNRSGHMIFGCPYLKENGS